jgi:predicted transposase YbfD/YdcC
MVTQIKSYGNNIGLPIFIKSLEDKRSNLGKRHELYVVIIIAIMGLMNGYLSFRGLEDFAERNKKDFYKIFKLKKKRMPKRDTFRRIFSQIEFEKLNEVFEDWIKQELKITKLDWFSLDGKAIKHTFPNQAHYFVTLVSLFAHKSKQIVSQGKVKHKSNEIPLSQNLLNHFEKSDCIFILDALNTQKKTINSIVENNNYYVLPVKNNHKTLLKQIKKEINLGLIIDSNTTIEKSRGRLESREVKLYENNFHKETEELDWKNIKQIIEVRRTVFYKKKLKTSQETILYISNLEASASEFNKGIRNHWLVESMHWIKDNVFKEDNACVIEEQSASNFSIMRSFALNMIRISGFENITQGIRLLMCDIKKMWKLMGGQS